MGGRGFAHNLVHQETIAIQAEEDINPIDRFEANDAAFLNNVGNYYDQNKHALMYMGTRAVTVPIQDGTSSGMTA